MLSSKKVLTATLTTALFMCGFPWALPSNAAPMVDQTQTITSATGTFYAYCSDYMGFYNSFSFGSTFTAVVSGLLTSVELPIVDATSVNPYDDGDGIGATMNIWMVDGISGMPTGLPMASEEITPANLNSLQGGGNLTVFFDTPPAVVATGKYAFTIDFPAQCPGVYDSLTISYGISDSGEKLINKDSVSTQIDPMYGIGFKTFVEVPTPAPNPTPTPTTAPAASLAKTGAEVDWLLLGSLIAVVAGAGLFALGRGRRTE